MEVLIELLKGLIEGVLISLKSPYAISIIVLYVLLKKYYPKFRGYMGEFWVKMELGKLPKNEYMVINDIMIKNNYGTHQIDHLIISKYGIFVIEMKNYYGMITGEDYKDKWIQHLGRNKYYFKNPINQNYGHVKVLEELLNMKGNLFIPIVCFSNNARLKIKSNNIVVQLDNLIYVIKRFRKPLIDKDINEIAKIINDKNIVDKTKRKKHVSDIKNKIKEENNKLENMVCPKCGNELVLRNGKYGTFIACSNYPKCKYTNNNN